MADEKNTGTDQNQDTGKTDAGEKDTGTDDTGKTNAGETDTGKTDAGEKDTGEKSTDTKSEKDGAQEGEKNADKKLDLLGDKIPEEEKPVEIDKKFVGKDDKETAQKLQKSYSELQKAFSSQKDLPESYEKSFEFAADKEKYGDAAIESIEESESMSAIVKILKDNKVPKNVVDGLAGVFQKDFDDGLAAAAQTRANAMGMLGDTPEKQKAAVQSYKDVVEALPVDPSIKETLDENAKSNPRLMMALSTMLAQLNGYNQADEVALNRALADEGSAPSRRQMQEAATKFGQGKMTEENYNRLVAQREKYLRENPHSQI